MNFEIKQQVVVVTGAAGLLGEVFCEAIAAHGGTAIVSDIALDKAERLAARLREAHGPQAAQALRLDIAQEDEVDAAVAQLHERYGRIDALVNNAYPRHEGYGRRIEAIEFKHFCANVCQHLGGYFLCTQRFARYFFVQERGNVINLGSIYGVIAPRFEVYEETPMTMPVEYAVIKAGVLQLTRYLAQYYKPHNIRVNAISPGGILTDQAPEFIASYKAHTLGRRMLRAVDLQGALLFLLSDASRHVTGQNIIVDDGWTL